MRPASIVNFERVVLASLVLGIISSFVAHEETVKMVSEQGMGTGFVYGVQAVTIVIMLLLLWFIARKGSPVAKWIYVVFGVLGLIAGVAGISQTLAMGTVPAILAIVQYVLTIVSIWLLFRPDAKAWFADGRGEAEGGAFR